MTEDRGWGNRSWLVWRMRCQWTGQSDSHSSRHLVTPPFVVAPLSAVTVSQADLHPHQPHVGQ